MDVSELMKICRDNLDFYKAQMADMEERLEELKNVRKLKEAFNY